MAFIVCHIAALTLFVFLFFFFMLQQVHGYFQIPLHLSVWRSKPQRFCHCTYLKSCRTMVIHSRTHSFFIKEYFTDEVNADLEENFFLSLQAFPNPMPIFCTWFKISLCEERLLPIWSRRLSSWIKTTPCLKMLFMTRKFVVLQNWSTHPILKVDTREKKDRRVQI